jgi:hypothetical protein
VNQVISFFVLVLLLATWVIQRIWNGLRGDFPRLPQLSYNLDTVDPKVLEALGTPRGGEAIASDAY